MAGLSAATANGQLKVGLALGGGAVRGIAHLGVLMVLEREQIPIHYVSGTSVGALVGALYSAGWNTADMLYFGNQLGWQNLARPVWPRLGLVSFDPMRKLLNEMLGDITFSELQRPFAVVAMDIDTGEMVTISEGKVAPAVVASCSVPGIVEPVQLNGRWLCDGGIVDNLPTSSVRKLGADFVIGVDVFQPRFRRRGGPLGMGLTAIEVMINRAGMGYSYADCLIQPRLAGLSYVLFKSREQLIAYGVEAAENALPALRQALRQQSIPVAVAA